MTLALVLLVLTASLFVANGLAARARGLGDARARIERTVDYDAASLAAWVKDHAEAAKWYAFPILIPLDLLCMAFLAVLLAYSSVALALQLGPLRGYAAWFVLLPGVYLAADAAEDLLLVRFLVSPTTIRPSMVRFAQRLTKLKLASVLIAIFQTIALVVAVALIGRNAGRG